MDARHPRASIPIYLTASAIRSPMTRVVCLMTNSKNFSVSNREAIPLERSARD
jgi:hypothetical protein